MCGIAGIVFPPSRPPEPSRVDSMTRAVSHRGPDGRGLIAEGAAVLGHTRLAILDPAGGHQPMAGDSAGVWIVYNGEIYNSPSLREELSRSRTFRTRSDTEVLIKGYEEWGEGVLDRLLGMFAFAIWDGPRQRLVLARDRVGIKPLLYSETEHGFVFASEMQAVLDSGLVGARVDSASLHDFLELGFVPAPYTIYSDVRRLPPGHLAVVEHGALRVRRYWSPAADAVRSGGKDALALEWEAEFGQAVERHRLSDVPIGTFLSGGIDSSLVTAALAERSESPVPVYCLGFSEPAWDETVHARTVAEKLGCRFHAERLDPGFRDQVPAILGSIGEPFGDSSIIPTWFLSRLAARDLKVVLSGDGGDELFAGYTRHQGERLARTLGRLPASALRPLARSLRLLSQGLPSGPASFARRLSRLAQEARKPMIDRYYSKSRVAEGADALLLLREHAPTDAGHAPEVLAEILDRVFVAKDPVRTLSLLDLEFYLPNDMLFKVDRASMAHSLEVRVPFLDHRIVELSVALPSSLKLRGFTTKWLLRRLVERAVGPTVAARPKAGFIAPVGLWFRGALGSTLETMLRDGALGAREWIDPGRALAILDAHRKGQAEHGAVLFNLLALLAWAERSRSPGAGRSSPLATGK